MIVRIGSLVLIAAMLLVGCPGNEGRARREDDPRVEAVPATSTRAGRASDGNDADGPLDIAWIQHGQRRDAKGRRVLVHTIRLFERWPVHGLRHQGFVHLLFQLRGGPASREERTLWIIYVKGKLRAEMYNTLLHPRFLARVKLLRPDARTVKVIFPEVLLSRETLGGYRWSALSFVEARHDLCPKETGCDDRAPDPVPGKRYFRHDL